MAKRHVAPLVNQRVRLRLLERADLPMTLAWRNQPHIRCWFLMSDIVSPEQHQAWYARYDERDDDFVFIVEETQSLHRAVGQVSIYNVDWDARRAEFGRLMIGDGEARDLGLARMATTALIEHALKAWHLQEIYLDVLASNAPARAVYRRCGFADAGTRDGVATMKLRQGSLPS